MAAPADPAGLQRLIIAAVAIALRRGEVTVLALIVFGRSRKGLLWFVVVLLRRLSFFAGSAHDILLLGWIEVRPRDPVTCLLTSISPPLKPILAGVG
jgi:hypothetical protein